MPAISVRLDHDLVTKVTALKSTDESLGNYVRRLIEREHDAHEHRGLARRFQEFLVQNPEEQAATEGWEAAPLVDDIEGRKE